MNYFTYSSLIRDSSAVSADSFDDVMMMSWSDVWNVGLRLQTSSASRAYYKQPKPQALLRKPQICFYSFPFPLLVMWQTHVPMSTEMLGIIML